MRYRLRTLLILLGAGPPVIAGAWMYPVLTAMLAVVLFAASIIGFFAVVGCDGDARS